MEVSIDITDKKVMSKGPIRLEMDKKQSKKRKSWIFIPLSILLILAIGSGIYFLYKGYKVGKDIGFNFSPGTLIEKKKDPELKKDSTGMYTNVLLVGIDTRENTKLLNTDVIIVVSYNHQTKDIVMISIPRDFYAKVNPDRTGFSKINSAYSINEGKEEGYGLVVLRQLAEEITGLEIQYHAMINFEGFIELIDAVGGVYVNVENSFTDYRYPLGTGYQTVSFKAGPQLMDGETALKYTRSRHSQQNGEGSDYARARRQQKVMDAFKDVLLSTETLLNPTKIMALLSSVQDNLEVSEFSLEDVQAGVNILRSLTPEGNPSSTYSFVLDPTTGNYSLITTDIPSSGYAIGPKEGLGKYTKINEYVQLAIQTPLLYSEDPSIYTYDIGLGYQESKTETDTLKENFKYLNIRFQGTKLKDKEGIYVYSNSTDEFLKSVDFLSEYLETENKIKPEYLTTSTAGDISILFGKQIVVTQESTQEETE